MTVIDLDAADRAWRNCGHRADYASAAEHDLECPAHGVDAQQAGLVDLDAIEALAAAATDGPWLAHSDGLVWANRIGDPVSASVEIEDAAFIAAARTAVPQMVAELRQHRAERDTPPAVELTDRELALAVRRWAVANGWTCHRWHGWINAATESAATIGVDWSTEDEDVTLRRRDPSGWWRYDVYPVGSLTQAVDLLAALGVLPAELSSAWRAGQAARP